MADIKAVIFDMDGLIFNTEDIYDEANRILLERRSKPYTTEIKRQMLGIPAPENLAILQEMAGLCIDPEDLRLEKKTIMQDLIPKQIQLMPGFSKLSNLLEELSLQTAIATSSSRESVKLKFDSSKIAFKFDHIVTSDDVVEGKPNPEVYLLAMKLLKVNPENTLVLEDSIAGVTSATLSGAITIAIPTMDPDHIGFAKADHIVSKLDDPIIFDLLKK